MRILYLMGSLDRGGTEILALNILKNAKSKDINAFLAYRKDGAMTNEFKKLVPTAILLAPKFLLDIIYFTNLRRFILSNNIQVVHANQVVDALYAYLSTIGLEVKICLSFHGFDFGISVYAKQIFKYIIYRTDLNIFVSNYVYRYYFEKFRFKNKSQVLHNGVDIQKIVTISDVNIRSELGISSNVLLLGSVGNFLPGRDQFTICQFLFLLKKQNINFKFLFIGEKSNIEADLYDNCYNFCQKNNLIDNVFFLGSRNDVPSILHHLDAFIYASNHDTFGIAVVEAMFAGLPVFVNDWDVMSEITEDGHFAFLYKTKNANDLLEKFLLYLSHKAFYDGRFQDNITQVKNLYGIDSYMSQLVIIYKKLLYENFSF